MAATCFSSLNVEKWKKRGRVDCNVSLELEIFQTLYLKLVIYPKKTQWRPRVFLACGKIEETWTRHSIFLFYCFQF